MRVVGGPYARAMGRVRELVDRVGILRPLRIRDFAFLWIGLTVSFIGDGVYIIAIAWQTYDLSNSPSALAAVGIAWSLPQVILLLITGVLSDRVDRRLLMIAGDVIRGVAIATIGIMSIGGTLTMTWLIGLVVVYGAGQALFGPAFSSIVPQVVPEDLLVEANSLGQFVRPVAWTLIGPLVGGALVASVGTGWAFIADASTFVVSAVMVGLMRTQARGTLRRPTHVAVDRSQGGPALRAEQDLALGGDADRDGEPAGHVGTVGGPRAVRGAQRPRGFGGGPRLRVRRGGRGVADRGARLRPARAFATARGDRALSRLGRRDAR